MLQNTTLGAPLNNSGYTKTTSPVSQHAIIDGGTLQSSTTTALNDSNHKQPAASSSLQSINNEGALNINQNGTSLVNNDPNIVESTNLTAQKNLPPQGTFERTSFEQLLSQYDLRHDLPPTIELTQAFLLTQNMKETASRVSGLTAGGSQYFLKNEIVGDSMRLSDAMQSVSRLLGNLGTSDKASNFLLEQRKLMQAQARENKNIREMIDEKIVDGLEYVRTKEKIALTKSRVKSLIEHQFTSDEETNSQEQQQAILSNGKLQSQDKAHNQQDGQDSITQEDSEEAVRNRIETENRIRMIISQLRQDAHQYLGGQNSKSCIYTTLTNMNEQPLQKICSKLRQNAKYRKKREHKAIQKGLLSTLEVAAQSIKTEIERLDRLQKQSGVKYNQSQLEKIVAQYDQYQGIEKRLQVEGIDKSISEIDSLPINQKTYEIQNVLLDFCGITAKGKESQKLSGKRDIFGRIIKLPTKCVSLQQYQDNNQNESSKEKQKKKNQELVKMIGLDPEKLFQTVDKYKIRINKMPKFSNVFERAEPIIPGLGMTVAGQLVGSGQGGQMTFARVDGRNVISLQFNPYEAQQDQNKKKQYDAAMKEIIDQREKIKTISKQAREKQEQSNIKRAWLNIVKKDIPKAFRQFQKYQADQETNNKKQSQNCLKEVRKKAIKTQRLAKETNFRAKKLTKEMTNFWKKRDKEMADLKRKKEKIEKELRRKQEEEKEALLQKKRLEFIMQQSEIYAHFMAKKLGLSDEQKQQREQDIDEERRNQYSRVQIDEQQAKHNVASMINENLSRVGHFDQETLHKKMSKHSIQEDELEVDKFDNPDIEYNNVMQAPSCFLGNLKEYQLKGLRWLDNLYDQGINGILADEMGLGKTIQAISLLAHLHENKGVWGPFLIIVPVTTLHNWQNELAKFCPSLKVLPYFGSPEERKKLGKFLDPKNLYNPATRVNVLLTSYNLIVNNSKDQVKLLKVKWHYMILDEAQAIKNNLSRRWKVLLQFQARNRLLLTGTPIQNSMAELWALLHFIMPKLFDSHEQFQEWFSKDIEQHSFHNQGEINKHQLRRLHLVLKPFMLRRLKKDVEKEIGPKVEYEISCEMTHRQRVLYHRIKSKISTKDLFQLVENKAKFENLMNLVMQFRKVCNHPELFERRFGRIPLQFKELQHGMSNNVSYQSSPDLRVQNKNPISYEIPKMIFDESFLSSANQTKFFRKIRAGVDEPFQEVGIETHMKFFNIFNTQNMHDSIFNSPDNRSGTFGILRLLCLGNKWALSELSYLFVADPLVKQIALMHYYNQKTHRRQYQLINNNDKDSIVIQHLQTSSIRSNFLDANIIDFNNRDPMHSLLYRYNTANLDKIDLPLDILPPLITDDLNTFTRYTRQMKQDLDIFVQTTLADPINFTSRSGNFNRFLISTINSSLHKKVLLGSSFKPKFEIYLGRIGKDKSQFLQYQQGYQSPSLGLPNGYSLIDKGIVDDVITEKGASILELPNYSRLVTDCAKMQHLDKLMNELHRDGHRVLIFCQMTKMLDILEDFLCWKKFTYFRMDGSTSIPDRRYMVGEYQKNPTIFAFLLSTRAGGLGINLIAADTVIFYDNDWNPTMDAQATDRAHRIGQTKKVSVYRLVTKRTVEERILKRAKQKQNVQSTVYGGSALKADVFNAKDVIDMLYDENEQQEMKQSGQFLRTKRVKRGRQPGGANNHDNNNKQQISTTLHRPQMNNNNNNNNLDTDMDMSFDNDKKKNNAQTPQKQQLSASKLDLSNKKPGRKPNPDKQVQQQKPQNSIFQTQRSNGQPQTAGGPFNIQKTSSSNVIQQYSNQNSIQQDNEYGDEDLDDDEDDGEEEEVDFFKMLEKAKIEFNDEDNQMPAEMEEDDEGGSKLKQVKGGPGDKGDEDGADEDDDMMVDDY